MITRLFATLLCGFILSSLCLGDSYLGSEFLTVKDAQKKWGISSFVGEKFKNASEKERGSMATDAIKRNVYVGTDMLEVRKVMGSPNSYFFSDTIYAYKITEPAANRESWQLIFVPDEKLEKVKEVKIRKKCCYKSPL
ncbi:MAG: hypothetical protein H6624_20245 [Bdellovibrionaceae bacterium]|nr:hypothetical protein [Bdellovibrionales bacterium]MCB9086684.1 hypothetical protein [Pseudobdellovibrionaceae bacterium]